MIASRAVFLPSKSMYTGTRNTVNKYSVKYSGEIQWRNTREKYSGESTACWKPFAWHSTAAPLYCLEVQFRNTVLKYTIRLSSLVWHSIAMQYCTDAHQLNTALQSRHLQLHPILYFAMHSAHFNASTAQRALQFWCQDFCTSGSVKYTLAPSLNCS